MLEKILYYEDGLAVPFSNILNKAKENNDYWKNQTYTPDTFLKALNEGTTGKIVDQLNHSHFIKGNSIWEFTKSSCTEEAYYYTGRSKDNQLLEMVLISKNDQYKL